MKLIKISLSVLRIIPLRLVLVLYFLAMLNSQLFAQKADKFGISLSGFVKTDVFFDSRQTVAAREGHFFLYPANESFDAQNNDINEKYNFNILSVQTRLKSTITAPDVFGAKTSGVIEGAFFGHSNGDINGFRLRHAIIKLDWEKTNLLIGQYWNPMFVTECFPGVVSFNTGAPFQPFARNPQVRLTQKFNKIHASFTAASQRDFASDGPNGTSSSYLRNAGLPILDFQLKIVDINYLFGAGVNFKSLQPSLSTANNYKSEEKVNGVSFMSFAKVKAGKLTIKAEGVYGKNLTDLLMLGGYAVKSSDPITAEEFYTPIKVFSFWSDLSYGKEIEGGLFVGYTENLGADDIITGSYYARGNNIKKVLRISPRIKFNYDKVRLAGELEITSAYYGTPDNESKVQNASTVTNVRLLIATYLFF